MADETDLRPGSPEPAPGGAGARRGTGLGLGTAVSPRFARVLLPLGAAMAALSAGVAGLSAGRPSAAGQGRAADPALPRRERMPSPAAGVNLSGIAYWSPQQPFLDRMRSAWVGSELGPFLTNGAPFTFRDESGAVQPTGVLVTHNADGTPTGVERDARGWITRLPSRMGIITYVPGYGPDEPNVPTRRFVVRWDGVGRLNALSAHVVPGTTGRMGRGVLEQDAAYDEGGRPLSSFQLRFDDCEPGDPPRNISMVREDQVPLFDAFRASGRLEDMFNPDFLASLPPIIRFMDWGGTNLNAAADWSERALPADATYASQRGVPVEVMIALCNRLGAHPHFCVPINYTDAAVESLCDLVLSTLKPTLTTRFELANEFPWNNLFLAASVATKQAERLRTAHGIDWNVHQWSLYRCTRVAMLADAKWRAAGRRDRLLNCKGAQTVWLQPLADAEAVIGYAGNAAAGLPPTGAATWADAFDVLMITGYFTAGVARRLDYTPAHKDRILRMVYGGEQGIADGLTEWEHGTILNLPTKFHLDEMLRLTAAAQAFAAPRGLALEDYEAGSHWQNYPAGQGDPGAEMTAKQRADTLAFGIRLHESPGAYDLFLRAMRGQRARGCRVFQQFTDCSSAGEFGLWGMRRYSTQPPTARSRALADFAANPGPLGTGVPAKG